MAPLPPTPAPATVRALPGLMPPASSRVAPPETVVVPVPRALLLRGLERAVVDEDVAGQVGVVAGEDELAGAGAVLDQVVRAVDGGGDGEVAGGGDVGHGVGAEREAGDGDGLVAGALLLDVGDDAVEGQGAAGSCRCR
jgi:hypothetical protein